MQIATLVQNEYLFALIIFVAFIVIAFIAEFILLKYVKRLAQRTKTAIDDELLNIISKPLTALIIIVGVFVGVNHLSLEEKYMKIAEGITFVIITLLVTMTLIKVLSFLITHWLQVKKKYEKTPKLINKFLAIFLYIAALIIILSHFNVEITPMIATLGIGGLAIGLALQNTLSNFFAGMHIIADKPINVGDFIELPDSNLSGFVEDIGWRSTRIRTLPNQIVIVPNSKLAENIIINDSQPTHDIAAIVQVGVSYESDLNKVEKVTLDVARKIQKTFPGAVKDFEPLMRYNSFGDSNINFTVILRAEKVTDRPPLVHEFIKALKAAYDKHNIEISWPVRKVYYGKK